MTISRRQKRWLNCRRLIINAGVFCKKRFGADGSILILALLIGVAAAFVSALLHRCVTELGLMSFQLEHYSGDSRWKVLCLILFLLFPIVGLFLSHCVQSAWGGRGYYKSLSPLILLLNRRKFNMPLSDMFTHWLSSMFAVGCGGSAGLEAPSVITGAAIGSNTAGFLHVDRKQRLLLIGCGTAAAISACFSSPIGGVLFTVEVLLPSFSVSALVPILMSSAVATVVSRVVSHQFGFQLAITAPWRTDAVPFYFGCGLFCALVGVYVIRTAYALGAILKKKFRNHWLRLGVGGAMLCLLVGVFPVLRGQGYLFIEQLFAGNLHRLAATNPFPASWAPEWVVISCIIIAAIFLKVVGSVLTVDSGGDGGIFAPSMYIGAFSGFAFARLVNLTGIIDLQEPNFIVVGMCGVFTAVMRAPLTGIFLIAEVTGGYTVLVPLMIVSAVSWFAARHLEPHSIYRKVLAENKMLADDRDHGMLQSLPVRLNISREFTVVNPMDTMEHLSRLMEENPAEIYPVLDEHRHLVGIIRSEKTLPAMLEPGMFSLMLVYDLMEPPRGILSPDDDLSWAMANFERYNMKQLPVCAPSGVFEGFISQEEIFTRYRRLVREADSF